MRVLAQGSLQMSQPESQAAALLRRLETQNGKAPKFRKHVRMYSYLEARTGHRVLPRQVAGQRNPATFFLAAWGFFLRHKKLPNPSIYVQYDRSRASRFTG